MKKYSLIFLCFLPSCFTSCNLFNKSDKWYEKTKTEFDSERQLILYKEVSNYDLRVDLTYAFFNDKIKQMNEINSLFGVEQNDLSDINYQFAIYNYGGAIRLCNQYIDDAFIKDFSSIIYIHALNESDNIRIRDSYKDEKYGECSIAIVTTEEHTIYNVFVTPLSQKAIDENKIDGLILIMFYDETIKKGLNVLFYADPIVRTIVEKQHSKIIENKITSSDLKYIKTGPGQFWYDVDF